LLPEGFGERSIFRDTTIDVLTMIKVIRQGGVHVSQGQVVLGSDFIRGPAQTLVPDRHIRDRDSTTGDPRSMTGRDRRDFNVLV
jgi:hypothetical protein